jgi:acetyl esterase/lipase
MTILQVLVAVGLVLQTTRHADAQEAFTLSEIDGLSIKAWHYKAVGNAVVAPVVIALAWVRAQPWADAKAPNNNVALLGWSHGAMTLLAADDDWTLPGPCKRMAERLQHQGHRVAIKVYPGAVHDFDTPVPGIRVRNEIPSNLPSRLGLGVQVGQNPEARADSWQRVRDILRQAFNAR